MIGIGTVETTIGLFAVVNIAALAFGYGRFKQRLDDFEERSVERLERIERSVGISNGDSPHFVRRSECFLMEQGIGKELKEIKERLTLLEREFREQLSK